MYYRDLNNWNRSRGLKPKTLNPKPFLDRTLEKRKPKKIVLVIISASHYQERIP